MYNANEDSLSPIPSTSAHLATNLVPLCDYDVSSSTDKEDDNLEFEQKVKKSPKKRKHLKRATGGTVGLLSKDISDELLKEPLLFESESYDWFGNLNKTLYQIFPGLDTNQDLQQLENSSQVNSELSETEYEVDLNSLEISKVLKRQKQDDCDTSGSTADSLTSLTASAAVQESTSQPSTLDDIANFQTPKLRNRKFIFKPFMRSPIDGSLSHDDSRAPVEVIIPEQLAASYGLYIWPSSPVLAWYIWLHQDEIRDKIVLELGSGTALPGLLCSKIGAKKVFLSDQAEQPNTLKNITEAVRLNSLEEKVEVVGLSWGDYTEELFKFDTCHLDYIIGSDLFFDPEVFESLTETISHLLTHNPKACVLISVQERSSDWSIEEWLIKYKLKCTYIFPKQFLKGTGIEESDLTGRHTIFILKLYKDQEKF